jgi:hypothetical protein
MDKMDQLQDLKQMQQDMAAALRLQRFLEQSTMTQKQSLENLREWFFNCLKREVSSRLAEVEAIFTSANVFEDVEMCNDILGYLRDTSDELHEYLNSLIAEYGKEEQDEIS